MKDELLDSDSITNHRVEESFSNGMSFNLRLMLMAGVGVVIAIAMLASGGAGYVIAPLILLGCAFIFTSSHGTDMSYSTNYVREYHKRFGMKSGKWIPMAAYSDLVILKISRTKRTADITGAVSTDLDVSKNEVFLMTHDHRRRFLIKVCQSYNEAVAFANKMADKLDKRVVVFNPKRSEQTMKRLRNNR